MEKQLLSEVNRVREIMGLKSLLEQEEIDVTDTKSDEEKYGHKSSSEPGEFKTYLGGKPFELFLEKSNILSKAYFQAGDYTALESKSIYYKYRRPNPYNPGGYLVNKIQKLIDELIEDDVDDMYDYRKNYGWFNPNPINTKGNLKGVGLTQDQIEKFGDMVIQEDETYYLDKKKYKEYLRKYYAEYPEKSHGEKKLVQYIKRIAKYKEQGLARLEKNNWDETYQYSNEKFKRKTGGEKNPEYNPEGTKEDKAITKAKKKIGDVNFSPADRIDVMDKISDFVDKTYEGDYAAASSDKIWKKKGNRLLGGGWERRGIPDNGIRLYPANIEIKEIIPEVIEQNNVGTLVDIQPSDADGQLFLNNLWAPSDFFKKQLDEMVENILINRDNVSRRFDGAKVKMTIATEICSGGGDEVIDCSKKIAYPYKIESSCSQVPNCVDDEGVRLRICGEGADTSNPSHKLVDGGSEKPRITFEQLSKNRANTAKKLIAEKLGAIGVTMTEPEIDWEGEHGNGTSGPAYEQGGAVESEEYKLARYVKIKLAVSYEVEDFDLPEPPEPKTYKVGDFRVTLQSDYDSWDPWWKIPPLRWPDWARFKKVYKNKKPGKYKTTECPKWMQNSFSGPKNNSMGSDISLKENINLVGKSNSGINIYEFDYIDKKFGSGRYRGVMAQEVPEASLMSEEGYLMVDYSMVDVDFEEI